MAVGIRQLERIRQSLADRDIAILKSLVTNRYLTTVQIRRLHFTDHASALACARATNRALGKLRDLKLIASLERRIGGVRAGSASFIWMITDAGRRLLHMVYPDEYRVGRLRAIEPSSAFLAHTLMISEICLTFVEEARKNVISLTSIEHEPRCWRDFISRDGVKTMLKPDLAIDTADGEFEDRWFIEADQHSEPLCRICHTCRRYQEYRDSGTEQRTSGVFPAVVWVTPDTDRRDAIAGRIRAEKGLVSKLFRVVSLPDLSTLIARGAGI